MGKLKSKFSHLLKNKYRKKAAINHDTQANNYCTPYDDDPVDMPVVEAPASNDIVFSSLAGPQLVPASITAIDYMFTNHCMGFNSAGNFIPNELMGK